MKRTGVEPRPRAEPSAPVPVVAPIADDEMAEACRDIGEVVLDTRESLDAADALLLKAAHGNPANALDAVQQIVQDWETSGAAALFSSEKDLALFYRTSMVGLFVQYMGIMSKALRLINQSVDDEVKAGAVKSAQLVALVERMLEQSNLVRGQAAGAVPKLEPQDMAELDERLAQVKRRVALREVTITEQRVPPE